ncbi:Transcriptional regulatory protein FlbD [Nymphon striatum]|nr:Transcriptional regulatory protein FlbD [Nymphon striatum]
MSSTVEALKDTDQNPNDDLMENKGNPVSFKRNSVLILDDEQGIRNFLQKGLEKVFGLVEVAEDVEEAEALRQRCNFDLIISDIRLPGKSGVDWVTEIREQGSTASPFRMDQMMASIEGCMERQQIQRENIVLKRQVDQLYDSGMIGECETMKSVCGVIKQIAPMPTTVLISGESGTVLEERVIRPFGSNREIPVDVNVRMPPLRERMDDLPALVQHFSNTLSSDLGVEPKTISGEDLFQMRDYHWPGNIRELRNVIERCLLLNKKPGQCITGQAEDTVISGQVPGSSLLEDIEKNHILKVLDAEDGNKSAAARILGVSRKTLERKVKAWNEM